ncbi:DUF4397 domain-containing protein [Bacillus sp. DJP31]|uniref:DUF4397 domain-containing protein n=1 Tax=Bacillus sp. DJP31 TaxID=3409789 RepID=UPI003BB5564F
MYPMNPQADYYFLLAAKYDLMSTYFKYHDPACHIHYYQKHLQAMQQAFMCLNQGKYRFERPTDDVTKAKVRVLHASPDAPAVDIYVDGQKVLQGVFFKQYSEYLDVPVGPHTIEVYPAGQMNQPVLRENVTVMPSVYYTLAATGTLNDLDLQPVVDKPFVEYGQTKARFVHLSPNAPAVDIVTKRGDVLFSEIAFRDSSPYQNVPSGKVDLQVIVSGTNNVALEVPTLTLLPNTAYSIYAVGLAGGSPALDALVLKDS